MTRKIRISFRVICGSDSRDARVAQHVMLGLQFRDDLRRLKRAQDVGRPYAMRSAFPHSGVVDAHELERRRYGSVWFDQRISKRATFREGQFQRNGLSCLSK